MKTFNIFYDIKISNGVLEERCLTVENVRCKIDAIHLFKENAPKNAIFRSVKRPLNLT